MLTAGLQAPPEHVIHADYTPEGGFAAMTSLLSLRPRPTAVFVANMTSAAGALHAAAACAVAIPADISVVTLHDLSLAAYMSPPLTTVRMPLADLGARALALLAKRKATAPIRETVSGPMELVVRESTAPPPDASRTGRRHRTGGR